MDSIPNPFEKESKMSSWRLSVLADRHRALGSKLEDWNGMGTAWTYDTSLADEHAAAEGIARLGRLVSRVAAEKH